MFFPVLCHWTFGDNNGDEAEDDDTHDEKNSGAW